MDNEPACLETSNDSGDVCFVVVVFVVIVFIVVFIVVEENAKKKKNVNYEQKN